jgi:hypothetical protein
MKHAPALSDIDPALIKDGHHARCERSQYFMKSDCEIGPQSISAERSKKLSSGEF